MIALDDKQMAEFYYRSFMSVDGLWFMKLEDRHGFDEALEIDVQVWKVLPKIQARLLKPLVSGDNPMEAFFQCYTTRLDLDGFQFNAEKTDDSQGFQVVVNSCPWNDMLVNSGRGNLAEKVGSAICNAVQPAWAAEFDKNISFELQRQKCRGSESCLFRFSNNS